MNIKEELIKSYKTLPLKDKRVELGKEIGELTLLTERMISDFNPNYKIKETKEFDNLFDVNLTEGEYLTGLYEDFIEMRDDISTMYELILKVLYTEDSNK